MEVDSRVVSAGEKTGDRRAVTGADQCRPRFTVKRRRGHRAVVRRRPERHATLGPMRHLLARAIAGATKFFVALAALVISVFSGGPEVDGRVTSAPRAGSRTSSRSAKREACTIDCVYNHEYGNKATEAKALTRDTVSTAANLFWLGCPGPPSSSM